MLSVRAVVEAAAIFVLIIVVGGPLVWRVAGELGSAQRVAVDPGRGVLGRAPVKSHPRPEPVVPGGQVVPVAEPAREDRVRVVPVPSARGEGPEVVPVPARPSSSPWSPAPSVTEEPPDAEVVEESPPAEVVPAPSASSTSGPAQTPALTPDRRSAD